MSLSIGRILNSPRDIHSTINSPAGGYIEAHIDVEDTPISPSQTGIKEYTIRQTLRLTQRQAVLDSASDSINDQHLLRGNNIEDVAECPLVVNRDDSDEQSRVVHDLAQSIKDKGKKRAHLEVQTEVREQQERPRRKVARMTPSLSGAGYYDHLQNPEITQTSIPETVDEQYPVEALDSQEAEVSSHPCRLMPSLGKGLLEIHNIDIANQKSSRMIRKSIEKSL